MPLDLSDIVLAMKAQSALDTPATGASAFGLEVVSSQGLRLQSAPIQSRLTSTTRMRKRSRPGSKSLTGQFGTELSVGACDEMVRAVLGASGWTAAAAYTNTDWGAVDITGTGVTATFASGTLVTDGVRAGMFIKFTNLSVAGNNNVYVPILAVTETVATLASGFLADNASDAAWNAVVARQVYTPATYVKTYYTVEEYWGSTLDIGERGLDMVFNSFGINCRPNQPAEITFGLVGRDMDQVTAGNAPNFTSPVFVSNESLVLLDGTIVVDGTVRADFTGINLTLQAPANTVDMLSTRISPDVYLGQFELGGNMVGTIADGADLTAFLAENTFDLLLHFAENEADPADFFGLYFGNMSYRGFGHPVGGEGAALQTMEVDGGRDLRGTGYAATTILASTSYAP